MSARPHRHESRTTPIAHHRSLPLLIVIVMLASQIGSPTVVGGTEAPRRDVAEYARMVGVDIAEAERRLALQDTIAQFRQELELEEASAFGGLYIDHEPQYRVVVQFTEGGGAALRRHPPPASIVSEIALEKVDYTLQQLHNDLETLSTRIDDGPYALDIDITENRVVVEATQRADAEALESSPIALPPTARVKIVEELPSAAVNFYGGLHLPLCTLGFTMWKFTTANSNRRVTTAGHCGNSQTYNGAALTYMGDEQKGPGHDEQSHKLPGATYRNWIRDDSAGGTRSITAKRPRIQQDIGQFVCHYGKTTGYGCGFIVSVTAGSCGGSGSGNIGLKVDSDPDGPGFDLSEGGDSGGPWFLNSIAFGTTSCQQGFDAIYVAIDVVESGLGATLLITP